MQFSRSFGARYKEQAGKFDPLTIGYSVFPYILFTNLYQLAILLVKLDVKIQQIILVLLIVVLYDHVCLYQRNDGSIV